MNPFVVVEGDDGAVTAARRRLERRGWQIVEGWQVKVPDGTTRRPPRPYPRVVRAGEVGSKSDAASALLTALGGAGLLIVARADRGVIDALCDDLTRLGPVDHRAGDPDGTEISLTDEQWALISLMLQGHTLGQAADRLHLARRTVDRRVAGIRRAYRVTGMAQALAAARRRGDV